MSYNLLEYASSLGRLYFRPGEEHFEQERRWTTCDKFAERWLFASTVGASWPPTQDRIIPMKRYIKEKVYITLFVNRNNFRKWNLTSKQSCLNFSLRTNWKSHSFNRKSIGSMALVNVRRIAFKLVSERKGRAFFSEDFEKASVSFTAS